MWVRVVRDLVWKHSMGGKYLLVPEAVPCARHCRQWQVEGACLTSPCAAGPRGHPTTNQLAVKEHPTATPRLPARLSVYTRPFAVLGGHGRPCFLICSRGV